MVQGTFFPLVGNVQLRLSNEINLFSDSKVVEASTTATGRDLEKGYGYSRLCYFINKFNSLEHISHVRLISSNSQIRIQVPVQIDAAREGKPEGGHRSETRMGNIL